MKVRLLKPYGMLAAGAEMDVRASIAVLLIQRKVAEEVVPAAGVVAAIAAQLRSQKAKVRR